MQQLYRKRPARAQKRYAENANWRHFLPPLFRIASKTQFGIEKSRSLCYVLDMEKILRIGTRGSELALKQVELFTAALREKCPHLQTEVVVIRTAGDARTDIPLNHVNRATNTADKGVFIAAIEEALSRGEIDCAVHSCKDMPGTLAPGMALAAVLPREETGDTLVVRAGANLQTPCIGTSSVRRASLAKAFWSGRATIVDLRGNVPTRLQKLAESDEMDAILLARAGLNRLGWKGCHSVEICGKKLVFTDLSCDSFMPALCQGAIVIEVRRGDTETYNLARSVNHESSELTIRAERAFLAALQADCSVPVAGYAALNGRGLMLRAVYFTPDGLPLRLTLKGDAAQPEQLGQAAAQQLFSLLGQTPPSP